MFPQRALFVLLQPISYFFLRPLIYCPRCCPPVSSIARSASDHDTTLQINSVLTRSISDSFIRRQTDDKDAVSSNNKDTDSSNDLICSQLFLSNHQLSSNLPLFQFKSMHHLAIVLWYQLVWGYSILKTLISHYYSNKLSQNVLGECDRLSFPSLLLTRSIQTAC